MMAIRNIDAFDYDSAYALTGLASEVKQAQEGGYFDPIYLREKLNIVFRIRGIRWDFSEIEKD